MGPGAGVLMANTKRETGRKVQQGNIMAAKARAVALEIEANMMFA